MNYCSSKGNENILITKLNKKILKIGNSGFRQKAEVKQLLKVDQFRRKEEQWKNINHIMQIRAFKQQLAQHLVKNCNDLSLRIKTS